MDSVCLVISRYSARLVDLSLASEQGQEQGQDMYSYPLSSPHCRCGAGPIMSPSTKGRQGGAGG